MAKNKKKTKANVSEDINEITDIPKGESDLGSFAYMDAAMVNSSDDIGDVEDKEEMTGTPKGESSIGSLGKASLPMSDKISDSKKKW
ncbi:hypothetical protein OXPF_07660 [Oxobacter pfennigii]|uniref:Uncharacterized protein n=1 Tax=Oxobacter pfennigii TaxID=36849 RepID=A0A0P8WA94_9CLOT|nr:hypothetical protein [Oxobacter pfennigii]KPU45533.1 hypothetical protein OXPF_07660 [Oxobacter pfennigii]